MSSSRPSRGAWIEIAWRITTADTGESRPSRGAWIEICYSSFPLILIPGRAPRGARGLKFLALVAVLRAELSRAPRGARGLKSNVKKGQTPSVAVAPLAGRVD